MVVRDQGKVDDHCAAIGSNYLIRYFYFFQVRNEFRILWIRRDFAAFLAPFSSSDSYFWSYSDEPSLGEKIGRSFLKKWAKPGLLLFIFVLFTWQT